MLPAPRPLFITIVLVQEVDMYSREYFLLGLPRSCAETPELGIFTSTSSMKRFAGSVTEYSLLKAKVRFVPSTYVIRFCTLKQKCGVSRRRARRPHCRNEKKKINTNTVFDITESTVIFAAK
ncbi:hypothetical protein RF11_14733 [Thelohanellus kitauei]|uniref:Uncharacterized protein n=1 Tax=Thelohanellus kitauei TaxID=669202 RepID=A0A0C2MXF1_THEKT|nr:hypothetical protein RF11_14733 [Thelohanellus kitauei]